MTDRSAPRRPKAPAAKKQPPGIGAGNAAGHAHPAVGSKKRAEASLDDALKDTFPASDPVGARKIT